MWQIMIKETKKQNFFDDYTTPMSDRRFGLQ